MDCEQVVHQFVAAVNEADVDSLAGLMTDGHVFVDSDGSTIAGRETVREAWSQYFSMMPHYRICVEETFSIGNKVVLVGSAAGGGESSGQPRDVAPWSVPAAWRAVVEHNRVAVWQVFVNPEPILAAMRGRGVCAPCYP